MLEERTGAEAIWLDRPRFAQFAESEEMFHSFSRANRKAIDQSRGNLISYTQICRLVGSEEMFRSFSRANRKAIDILKRSGAIWLAIPRFVTTMPPSSGGFESARSVAWRTKRR